MTGRAVEHTALRLALVAWVALALVSAVAARGEASLTARVALVIAAGILVVEGARWAAERRRTVPEPWVPLVRRRRRRSLGRPTTLQGWIDLCHAADRDGTIGPVLRDRLAELAASRRPSRAIGDGARLETVVAALEEP